MFLKIEQMEGDKMTELEKINSSIFFLKREREWAMADYQTAIKKKS